MREMMKAFNRFSWALSLFGSEQVPKFLTQPGRSTAAFDSAAEAAGQQLGDSTRTLFQQGDRLQFWAPSVQTISGGTGRYAGALGMSSFNGSSYFAKAPDFSRIPEGIEQLTSGFPLKISINVKVIHKKDVAG